MSVLSEHHAERRAKEMWEAFPPSTHRRARENVQGAVDRERERDAGGASAFQVSGFGLYRGTSPIRKRPPPRTPIGP